jgi:hypothetical protein
LLSADALATPVLLTHQLGREFGGAGAAFAPQVRPHTLLVTEGDTRGIGFREDLLQVGAQPSDLRLVLLLEDQVVLLVGIGLEIVELVDVPCPAQPITS